MKKSAQGKPHAHPVKRVAPKVLALHGFTGTGKDFEPLFEAMPQFEWFAPDLPGHATDLAVPGAPGDDCSLEANLRHVEAFLDERTKDVPLILLGYSMGGRLALRLALARPDRFSALITVGTSPGLKTDKERALRRLDDENLAREIIEKGMPAFLEKWQARQIIATQANIPWLWRTSMRARRLKLRPDGLAASLRGFGQGALEPVLEKLKSLPIPAMFCAGKLDVTYLAATKAMGVRCKDSETFVIPDAGHMAHLENLLEFAAGFRGFLMRNGLGT